MRRSRAPINNALISMKALHVSKLAIASAAKQSILACEACTYGSPRRCAPRDDGRMQTIPTQSGGQAVRRSGGQAFKHSGIQVYRYTGI